MILKFVFTLAGCVPSVHCIEESEVEVKSIQTGQHPVPSLGPPLKTDHKYLCVCVDKQKLIVGRQKQC